MTEKTKHTKVADFEAAIKKLEAIVDWMEQGNHPLEKMIAEFEKATKLVEQCRKALDQAEQRVRILTKDKNQLKLENFTDDNGSED